ncbi:unnamed protein product, partial [Polarella glacialis]
VLQVFAVFSIDGFTKPTLLTKTSQKYIQREFLGKKSHGSRMPNALDGAAGTSESLKSTTGWTSLHPSMWQVQCRKVSGPGC